MTINAGLFTSNRDDWETPQDLFDQLHKEFHFTLDPCADEKNHKCEKWYSKAQDGLTKNWGGDTVFCNPPYGRELQKWIRKCSQEARKDGTTVVMLIPARTDTKAFHEYIYGKAEVRFLRGRLKFGGAKWNAPFPSMLVIFRAAIRAEDEIRKLPPMDAVKVVRCKECQYNPIDTWFECPMSHLPYNENGWCWKGEKRGLTHLLLELV